MPASVRTLADGHETWRFDAKRDGARRRREESRVADTPFLLTNDRRSRFSARLVHASRPVTPPGTRGGSSPRARSRAGALFSAGRVDLSSPSAPRPALLKIFPQKRRVNRTTVVKTRQFPPRGNLGLRGDRTPRVVSGRRASGLPVRHGVLRAYPGDADVFGTAKAHKLERLTAIPETTFVETARDVHGTTAPRLAQEIQADGSALMLRGELRAW